jgi:hypothetical protein
MIRCCWPAVGEQAWLLLRHGNGWCQGRWNGAPAAIPLCRETNCSYRSCAALGKRYRWLGRRPEAPLLRHRGASVVVAFARRFRVEFRLEEAVLTARAKTYTEGAHTERAQGNRRIAAVEPYRAAKPRSECDAGSRRFGAGLHNRSQDHRQTTPQACTHPQGRGDTRPCHLIPAA